MAMASIALSGCSNVMNSIDSALVSAIGVHDDKEVTIYEGNCGEYKIKAALIDGWKSGVVEFIPKDGYMHGICGAFKANGRYVRRLGLENKMYIETGKPIYFSSANKYERKGYEKEIKIYLDGEVGDSYYRGTTSGALGIQACQSFSLIKSPNNIMKSEFLNSRDFEKNKSNCLARTKSIKPETFLAKSFIDKPDKEIDLSKYIPPVDVKGVKIGTSHITIKKKYKDNMKASKDGYFEIETNDNSNLFVYIGSKKKPTPVSKIKFSQVLGSVDSTTCKGKMDSLTQSLSKKYGNYIRYDNGHTVWKNDHNGNRGFSNMIILNEFKNDIFKDKTRVLEFFYVPQASYFNDREIGFSVLMHCSEYFSYEIRVYSRAVKKKLAAIKKARATRKKMEGSEGVEASF